MVDSDRVARLLRSISDDLAVLRAEAAAGPGRRADPLWLRGIKYVFVTAIEASLDVAQHICSSAGWGPPKNNADAVRLLGRHGIIDPELADRVARAIGFRNVLVHEYVDVDDRIVLERLEDPSDLTDYVASVAEWLSAEDGSS